MSIGRDLDKPTLLNGPETAWWNAYRARVWEILSRQLEGEALALLKRQCAPL